MSEENTNGAWINELVRPIESKNAELGVAAREELRSLHAEEPATLARRFEDLNSRPEKRRRTFYWGIIILALLVALSVGGPYYFKLSGLRSFVSGLDGIGTPTPFGEFDPMEDLAADLSPADRLYVFGDPAEPTQEARARELWQTYPEDPWLFQDYLDQRDTAPPDLLDEAAEVDPGNAFYFYLAAGELTRDAVEKSTRPHSGPRENRPKLADWKVVDEQAYREALALFDEGLRQPRMDYFGGPLLRKRLGMLPPEHDLESRIARVTFAMSRSTSTVFDFLYASNLVAARAYLLGEDQKTAELEEWIPHAERFCLQLADQDGTLVRQLVALAGSSIIYGHLAEACDKCNLPEKAGALREKLEAIESIRTNEGDSSYHQIKLRGDMLAALAVPVGDRLGIPGPSLDELKPGRMMNYALFDRVVLLMASYNFSIALVALLVFPLTRGKLVRCLGHRFAELLTVRDWLWILGLGIVAPLVWHLVLTFLTPVGHRDWALMYALGQPMALHATCTLTLMFFASLTAVRWRLERAAAGLGFRNWRKRLSLVMIALLALALPVTGLGMRLADRLWPVWIGAGILIVANLWLTILILRALFGKRHRALARIAVARVLAPVFAVASLLMLSLLPLTVWAERSWLAQDELMRSSAENLGMGVIEGEASSSVRERLVAALTEDGN